MTTISIANNRMTIDEASVSLISGEIHYWRIIPDNWSAALEAIAELGIETIATYVPWQYHETADGIFDFVGSTLPSRNLRGFLDLVKSKRFSLVIRPGPYIHAEWPNAGVPDRVVPYHRMHPVFKDAAQVYVVSVSDVLLPYLATNGGPIIALQADNNIECWDELYQSDLGLSGGTGMFQEFLSEKYGNINALNASWGTQYSDFSDAKEFASIVCQLPQNKRRFSDTCRFRYWYTNRYAEWIRDRYVEAGIDIPIYFNGYGSFNKEQNLVDLASIGAFAGPNCYPSNEFKNDTAEHRKMLEDLRYVRLYSPIPYIAEFEAGIWHGYHYSRGIATPKHHRHALFTAIQAGITAWNWYMLVGRDNWYGSPINEWGQKAGELFSEFRRLIQITSDLDLATWHPLTSCAVTLNNFHAVTPELGFDDSALAALYEAGLAYDFFDLNRGRVLKPLLFYSGSTWLPNKHHEILLNYIEQGGNLVVFQTYPRENEDFEPLNLLQIKEPSFVSSKMFIDSFDTDVVIRLGEEPVIIERPSTLFHYMVPEATPIMAKRIPTRVYGDTSAEWSRKLARLACSDEYCVGYKKRIDKGTLTVIGLKPNADLIVGLHRYFNLPIYCRPETQLIQAGAFEWGGSWAFVVTNQGTEPKSAVIRLDSKFFRPGSYKITDLIHSTTSELVLAEPMRIVVELEGKDGTVVKLDRLS
jgi:hypothetical protein